MNDPTPAAPGSNTRLREFIIPRVSQLLPAPGPKKSPQRTTMDRTPYKLALCSRNSISTRTWPLRELGICGEFSRNTGMPAPKL